MYVANRAQLALATIGERMAQVVDPSARARMTGEYLALLNEYHAGKVGPDFERRVQLVLSRSGFGQTSYKLTPALGTINDRFFRAYADAAAALERLEALAARQSNPELRQKWEWFLKDNGQELTMLHDEAEIASANVHLSRMDALASQASNILAARLMPAEVEWRRRLQQPPVTYAPRGNSAAVSRQALALNWYPGHRAVPPTLEQKKYPYARGRMRDQPGQGVKTGLAGIFDSFQELVTGAVDMATGTAAASAGETRELFNDAVKRLAGVRDRLAAAESDLARLQASGAEAEPLAEAHGELGRRYASAKAGLEALAADLKTYSYDTLDTAQELVRGMLGQPQVPGADSAGSADATWLLFRGQVTDNRDAVLKLEKDAVAAETQLGAAMRAAGLSAAPRAGAVALSGGILTLAAGAAALVWFGRRRK